MPAQAHGTTAPFFMPPRLCLCSCLFTGWHSSGNLTMPGTCCIFSTENVDFDTVMVIWSWTLSAWQLGVVLLPVLSRCLWRSVEHRSVRCWLCRKWEGSHVVSETLRKFLNIYLFNKFFSLVSFSTSTNHHPTLKWKPYLKQWHDVWWPCERTFGTKYLLWGKCENSMVLKNDTS